MGDGLRRAKIQYLRHLINFHLYIKLPVILKHNPMIKCFYIFFIDFFHLLDYNFLKAI